MKKGLTLVEVLVSITLFVISFATCISIYFISLKQETRQKEYLAFENICLEIDAYSEKYGNKWNIEYFGNEDNIQYFDEKYRHLKGSYDVNDIKYTLTIYFEDSELIINIFERESGRYIIKDLNYGGARYE